MTELREGLEALANRGDPRGASNVLRNARRVVAGSDSEALPPHPNRRHIFVLVVAAATILAITGGAVLLVRDSGNGEPRVEAAGDGATNQDASTTGAPLFLVPRTVPDGFQLLRASGGDRPGVSVMQGGSPEWDRTQRWVRFDAAHERPVEVLDIQWGPGSTVVELPGGSGGSDDPLGALRYQSVPVEVRGRDGVLSDGWLAWEEPDGRAVLVTAILASEGLGVPTPGPLSREFLYAVAEGLEPRDDGGFDLRSPPEGFELVAEWPGVASEGTNPRTVTYQAPDGRGFQLQIVDDTESPPGINLYYSSARLVDVRGHDAVLSPFLFTPPGAFDQQTLFILGADRFVQWIEVADTRVTISGVGLSDSELLDIARDLQAVDPETWFGLSGFTPALPSPVLPEPAGLPEPDGPPPSNEAEARERVIRAVEVASAGASTAEEREAYIENSEGQDALRQQILDNFPGLPLDEITARVDEVRFLNPTTAAVRYTIVIPGWSTPEVPNRIGRVVLVDGTWKATRETACNDLLLGGVTCPPLETPSG